MVRVTYRLQKRLLQAAVGLLAAGCLWAGWLLVNSPEVDTSSKRTSRPVGPATANPVAKAAEPLNAYAVIHERDLRRPLVDPKPPPKPVPPKPKLTITLQGTAVEPGHNYAFFSTSKGETKIASEGQTLEGAQIVSIGVGEVVVTFHGETITLQAPKEGGGQ
jgi:hypothetical protein